MDKPQTTFRTQRRSSPNWLAIIIQCSWAPIWQRGGAILAWLTALICLVLTLLWFGQSWLLTTVGSEQRDQWLTLMFFALACCIQIGWMRQLWQKEMLFTLHNTPVRPVLVLLLSNLGGGLVVLALLIAVWIITVVANVPISLSSWWHIPMWCLVLWLTASYLANWDVCLRFLAPSVLVSPLLVGLLIVSMIFATGAAGSLLGGNAQLALIAPGATISIVLETPYLALLVTWIHWIISIVAAQISSTKNAYT